jgi:anthranilate phosphoribosyltransferase
VAKHGNRSHARPSGSAEVLAALGVNIAAEVPVVERCLRECRLAFLHAQRLHPAMRFAAPVRQALGIRTIFNLLGPLTNPAGVRRQLVGVGRPEHVERLSAALRALGAERAMVVHGSAGLCDLSLTGPSQVARWDGRTLACEEIDARVIGAEPAPLAALFIDSPAQSAAVIEHVLAGQPGPAREMVVLNAAAALWVAGLAENWAAGALRARQAIDSGAARDTLARWRAVSHQRPEPPAADARAG